ATAAAATAPVTASQPDASVPTIGAIPDSSVSARPLEQQAPAPVSNSNSVHPGNPKATP
ncbi:BON domain-containing protein, partial [Paraburkholderia sp. SIMBA_027]